MKNKLKFAFDEVYVWDTLKARGEIRQAIRIAEKFGPMDHLDLVEANLFVREDIPCFVAFSVENGRLSSALFLNSFQKDFFRSFPRKRVGQRLVWLLDAMLESLQIRENFEAGDPPAVQFAFSPSPSVALGSMNVSARFFYIRQRRLDRAIRENLSDSDHRPLTLARLYDEDTSPANPAAQLTQAMAELPHKVASMTRPVVEGRNKDIMDVWMRSAHLVSRILGLLVQKAAAFDATVEWAPFQRRLSEDPVFARFFEDSWPVIHSDWLSAAARTRPENRLPSGDVVAALASIFKRLGIHILDEPKGMTPVEFRLLDITT